MKPALARAPGLAVWTWRLLRLRVRIWLSTFRHGSLRGKTGTLILGALVLALLAASFAGSWALLALMRSPQLAQFIDPAAFLLALPSLVFTAAFLGILVTSFGVLLQALYLARDMDFLLAAPIPMRAVFASKLIQAVLPNFALICLFALPVLLGLGASSGYNALFYAGVPLLLVTLALGAAGLASILVMGVVRLVPARRVAEVLGFVGAISAVICSQSGQFASQMRFGGQETSQAVALLARLNSPWSPFAWAGRGLLQLGSGHWAGAAVRLGATLLLALLAFAVTLRASEQLYYRGWSQMQAGTRRRPNAPARAARRAGPVPAFLRLPLPRPVLALVAKDALVLRRDLRNLSQLVTPLVIGIAYAVMLLRGGGVPAGRGQAPGWLMRAAGDALLYVNVGLSLFIGWGLLSRLAMMAFSQEGRSYWIIKSSPVASGQLLIAKFIVAYLPTFLLGEAFLVVITALQRGGVGILLSSTLVVALALAGAVGVSLAFGVANANLDWEDPRQMVRGAAGCLGTLASFACLAIAVGLFFGPAIAFPLLGGSAALGRGVGLILGSGLSLACALLPPSLVSKRVARIGESRA